MDQLTKQAAEIALRLAALPADGLRTNQDLDVIERLAMAILREVSAARVIKSQPAGELRGVWRAMQPTAR